MSSVGGTSTQPTDLTVEDGHEQEEDDASTPRRPLLDLVRDQPQSAEATPVADTPAARLRALLSRVPNSATPKPSAPQPPSELESDFDTPHGSSSGNKTPHVSARESLKELFSRAMREGGDSPVKGRNLVRRRRNSIGSSGVEESPRKSRVKRMSMSDEEAERMTNNTSQNSVRSSSAATFDSLRARLSNVNTIFGSSQHEYNSMDKETQLNDISLPSGPASPPAATSTPLRQSISQFPSQFSGSNLLNEDSDMQRNVRDVEIESSVDISHPRPRTLSTPHQASTSKAGPSSVRHTGRPDSQNRTSLVRHGSADTTDEMSSRASSSQSAADYKERVKDRDQDLIREREKAWNWPTTSILSRHHSGTRSPVANRSGSGLTRRGSSASLLSSDGDGNGRLSSASTDVQQRKGKEREHSENHEHLNGRPNLSRAQSAQTPKHPPHGERTRTLSQPTRPGSSPSQPLVSGSPAVRERKLSHRRSSSSLNVGHNGAARAASPASSLASHESLDEFEREKQHERERNWNSARPKWELTSEDGHEHHHPLTRGASPLPDGHHHHHSRNESPHEKRNGHVNGTHKHSITEGKLAEWSASVANASNSIISHLHSSRDARPRSPHHPTTSTTPPTNPNKSSGSASRFGWSFPRSKSPLPPLEEDHNPSRVNGHQRMPSSPSPAHRPEHSSAAAGTPSHIPVRRRILSETTPGSPGGERRKGHKRSTTELSESIGSIPPSPSKPYYESSANHAESQQEASTSAGARPGPSGNGIQHTSPPQENNQFDDSFSSSLPRSFSPPPSPPDSRPSSSVSTPKRNSTMASMKMEFQTPSPPKGLPPLPGPPSSAGDEESDRTPVSTPKLGTQANGIENMKTPRPPGAWSTPFTTPMPERASSLPLQKNPSDVYLGMRPDTPPASLSRATSMTMQTPAPPGAWASPSGRRKPLKVRFDDDPSAQDITQNRNAGGDHSTEQFTSTEHVPTGANQADRGTIERSPSPPKPAPRTPRRSPGIRMLDAFGNELPPAQEEPESLSESKDEEKSSSEPLVVESPSRRKSKIRILDAMGREIPDEEPGLLPQTEDSQITSDTTDGESPGLDKTQAKDLLQRTIADLRSDLVAIDRVPEVVNVDDSRLTTLYEASRRARAERTKIDQQMRLSNEELVREAGFRSKNLAMRRPVWANRMFFWFTIMVQVILILIMYRVSKLRAHHMFLTTYYDPFYPELHHHVTRPELVRMAMNNSATSSSVPLWWGLRGMMLSLWERTLNALAPLSHGLFSDNTSHEPLFYPT